MLGDPAKKIQAGEALPTTCSGTYSGGLCSGLFYVDISFDTPFESIPTVGTAYARLVEPSGCLQSATDAEKVYATNVTTHGFRLWSGGSPSGPAGCGVAYDSWWYGAYALWIATLN
jgi:hypothetical protein